MPGEVTYVCLWGSRNDGYNFEKNQFIVWRYLQKAQDDLFELKLTYSSAFLILRKDEIKQVPQTRVFQGFIPYQEPEPDMSTIKELEDEKLLPKMSGLFAIELEDASNSMFYYGCPREKDGLRCCKKTEKRLFWICGSGHTSTEPLVLFRVKVKCTSEQTGIAHEVVFLCDKAEQLFGLSANEIRKLPEKDRKKALEEKLKNQWFYLTLHPKVSDQYPFQWLAYDVVRLGDERI